MVPQAQPYELVLLGPTAYTGKLCVEYIATHCPTDLKWAIAGRNSVKLEAICQQIKSLSPDRPLPDIEVVELKPEDLVPLVKKTRVLVSAIGPYTLHGTQVFKACAENGTHYVDCTGEVPWVKEMIDKYHSVAQRSGAIMIPQCGFDSVPADIITWALVNYIREEFQSHTAEVTNCLHSISGNFSGGTLRSIIAVFDVYSIQQVMESTAAYALSPSRPTPTKKIARPSITSRILGIRTISGLGVLSDSPQAPLNLGIVQRSWGLFASDDKTSYGPNFVFHEYLRMRNAFKASVWHFMYVIIRTLILLPFVRKVLQRVIPAAGEGLSEAKRKKASFEYRAVGTADSDSAQRALVKFRYEGDAYLYTANCMIEGAMIIIRGGDTEAHKRGGGIWTPSLLGGQLLARLKDTGTRFEIKTLV